MSTFAPIFSNSDSIGETCSEIYYMLITTTKYDDAISDTHHRYRLYYYCLQ